MKLLITKSSIYNKNERVVEIIGTTGEKPVCEKIINKFITILQKKSRQFRVLQNKSSLVFTNNNTHNMSIRSSLSLEKQGTDQIF